MPATTTDCRQPLLAESAVPVLRVLRELNQARIEYCVLRGGDPRRMAVGNEEIDLLIRPGDLRAARRLLLGAGFVELRAWGHAPHHFFVTYDGSADRWIKLDMVTSIAYGRPNHALVTDLAENGLRNRRSRGGGTYLPSPEDEWITLLLHCLLDKGSFSAEWQERLRELAAEITDDSYMDRLVRRYWSPGAAPAELRDDIREGNWSSLLGARRSVERRLAGRCRLRWIGRQISGPLLRKLHRLVRFFHPQAISVAVLAPDGAGKSTLAQGIVDECLFPVEQIYMGLYQKPAGIAGARGVPGFGFVGKVLTQWRRYLAAQLHKARGRFVIFDRYTYDALLPSPRRLNRWQRLRRWLLAHACPGPDLIVVLDAPGELLFARKGEHSAEWLEQQRQAYLSWQHRFPQLVVVDAARDASTVRREVTAHIWRVFSRATTAGGAPQQRISFPST